MLELRERTCDNYVVVSLPSTAEKILADCSSNDHMCAHAIPTFTRNSNIYMQFQHLQVTHITKAMNPAPGLEWTPYSRFWLVWEEDRRSSPIFAVSNLYSSERVAFVVKAAEGVDAPVW